MSRISSIKKYVMDCLSSIGTVDDYEGAASASTPLVVNQDKVFQTVAEYPDSLGDHDVRIVYSIVATLEISSFRQSDIESLIIQVDCQAANADLADNLRDRAINCLRQGGRGRRLTAVTDIRQVNPPVFRAIFDMEIV